MAWVRSNIKCAARIALFAMAIQLALSFGHFHPIASAATPATEIGSASSQPFFAGIFSAQIASAQSTRQPDPDHDQHEHPGDICAICAVMAMANTAMFWTPPALPLPQAIEFSHLTIQGEFPRVASVRIAFQPRAPPIS